jgi:uncharacterized protein (DUF427 family)
MSDYIKIRSAQGTWVVRAGGAVLGESTQALELSEGSHAPVIYFPRADLAMAFLEASDHTTHCSHKGDATYFDVVVKSGTLQNAGWSYETPNDDVARIKDHVAFYVDRITVEQL